MINIDALLDSPVFWLGIFFIFVVVGRFAINEDGSPPKKKGK